MAISAFAISEIPISGIEAEGGSPPATAKIPVWHLVNSFKQNMAIRNQTLTVNFLAWDTSNNVGKTGDSANFTMRLIKDGGAAAALTNALSEPDSTNMPGIYEVQLTATEMDADFVTLHGKSSTANIVIIPLMIATESGDLAAIKGDTAAILLDTGTDGVLIATGAIGATQFAAGAIDAAAIAADAIGSSELAATAAEEIADTILLRKLDRSGNGTDLSNERTVVNALRALRNKQSIAAGTLTVTKENDTDTAWTASIATTAGDPISSIDPA